jgi:hypothetical protein
MTTVLDIIDIHGIMVEYLRSDIRVTDLVDNRVFARVYPDRMDFPAAKVLFPQTTNAAPPTMSWYRYSGQIECHGITHQEALGLAQAVQRVLADLEGIDHVSASFQAVDIDGVTSGVDEGMTPQRPRWIVPVTITARSR